MKRISDLKGQLFEDLTFLYGDAAAEAAIEKFIDVLEAFHDDHPDLAYAERSSRISEKDSILITYADMVQVEGETPLATLASFLNEHIRGAVSSVHILPFYPYSSDDGFSVIDYHQVNPDFGTWDHVQGLGEHFRLMFDAVINHISASSEWFRGFLKDDPKYKDYFTVIEPGVDLSAVFRPRATPVLTPFNTPSGEKLVWTTFSADQIDLNFASPDLLLDIAKVLLTYVANGADFIRLDAATFMWKEIGTNCASLPQTHRIVQTLRTVLDMVAPAVTIITETNVPHDENIQYFGDGKNEAQMVYNFALPMLTMHAFRDQNVEILTDWVDTLDLPSEEATFFNFLAGHDGIGMLPVKKILDKETLMAMAEDTIEIGGKVSFKSESDGSKSPYELNVNYLDILCKMDLESLCDPGEPTARCLAERFLATQAIMLSLRGVPGIYFHSLFGSRGWLEGVKQTGRARTINREKLSRTQLEEELRNPDSLRARIFYGYIDLLKKRASSPAFHPLGGQKVLRIGPQIFGLIRSSVDEAEHVICLHNTALEEENVKFSLSDIPLQTPDSFYDLLSDTVVATENRCVELTLPTGGIAWLRWRT